MNTKTCQALIGLVAFLAFGTALAGSKADIVVMTQNQYLGADLTPIVTADDPNAALIEALTAIANNNYKERVQALAESILDKQPHLVALQEVYAFTCAELIPLGQCQEYEAAFNNHLAETLVALGGHYRIAAVVQNLTLEPQLVPGHPIVGLPVSLDPFKPPIFVSVIDRDVILARVDVDTTAVPFNCLGKSSLDGCNYHFVAPASVGPVNFNIERGFVGVDATINGAEYRFINTHLEVKQPSDDPTSALLQPAQATELWGAMLTSGTFNPARRVIVAGDFNSSPVDVLPPPFVTAYQQFTGAKTIHGDDLPFALTDTWTLRPGNPDGFTCCELDDLSNAPSLHYERVDIVFAWPAPTKVKSNVLDAEVGDKTLSGLWPSDHAAVSAELSY